MVWCDLLHTETPDTPHLPKTPSRVISWLISEDSTLPITTDNVNLALRIVDVRSGTNVSPLSLVTTYRRRSQLLRR
jgi:hypothetical protein